MRGTLCRARADTLTPGSRTILLISNPLKNGSVMDPETPTEDPVGNGYELMRKKKDMDRERKRLKQEKDRERKRLKQEKEKQEFADRAVAEALAQPDVRPGPLATAAELAIPLGLAGLGVVAYQKSFKSAVDNFLSLLNTGVEPSTQPNGESGPPTGVPATVPASSADARS